MKLTPIQIQILNYLADGEWHEQVPPCSDNIRRRLYRNGLIEQNVARGAMYGITHPTRIRITEVGLDALSATRKSVGIAQDATMHAIKKALGIEEKPS